MAVGYRKLAVVVMVILIATVLVWLGKIGPDHFERIVIWSSGLYFGANVGAKVAQRKEQV